MLLFEKIKIEISTEIIHMFIFLFYISFMYNNLR